MRGILILLIATLAVAQDGKDDLETRISKLMDQTKVASSKMGIVVYSTKRDKLLYSLNPDKRLMPASNMKLFTTVCALNVLGADFKYQTKLYTRGKVEDGVLDGDIVVVGSGDPNISGRWQNDQPALLFKIWASKLKEKGITKIKGGIKLVNAVFDNEYFYSDWSGYPIEQWWVAPIGAFSLNDNCIDVKVSPGDEGQPCRIDFSPRTSYVKIINKTKTVREIRSPISYSRLGGSNDITISGDLTLHSKEQRFNVTIHDPTLFFGTVLKEAFSAQGPEVAGKFEEVRTAFKESDESELIDTYEFDLIRTLQVCNRVSQNFYAEMLLKQIGYKLKGKGTRSNGLEGLKALAKELKIEPEFADGAGLVSKNEATPNDILALLKYMTKHPASKEWINSLAAPSEEGSLRHRMPKLKGKVHAKTGHVAKVSCLSGYLETRAGDTILFSILFNNVRGDPDSFEDQLCMLLYDLPLD